MPILAVVDRAHDWMELKVMKHVSRWIQHPDVYRDEEGKFHIDWSFSSKTRLACILDPENKEFIWAFASVSKNGLAPIAFSGSSTIKEY